MQIPFVDYHIAAILNIYEQSTLPIDLTLRNYFKTHKSLGSKDRKTIGNTLYQMVRYQSWVDFAAKSGAPLDRLFALRNLDRSNPLSDAMRHGVPEFLYAKMIQTFGKDQTNTLCDILNQEAPVTIRANRLKTTREALLEKWGQEYGAKPCAAASDGITFPQRLPLFSFPEFKEGLFEMQDEGSQLITALVNPSPGDAILDFCSGSGGKTLGFAHLTESKGQIYLHDVRLSALVEAKKRLKRAGIQNAQCLPPNHPQLKKIEKKCDWVLIDVPCSGTGTFRRNPDQKWKLSQDAFDRLKATQFEIAKQAIHYLKPNGKLVYTTCSIFPEENQAQVDRMMHELSLELSSPMVHILPTENGPDGFFGAVLKLKNLVPS
jgi:16S rRNA C967 or C1407 C5-methylase (RsmB/RsmF family)